MSWAYKRFLQTLTNTTAFSPDPQHRELRPTHRDHEPKAQDKVTGLKYKELMAQKLIMMKQELVQNKGDTFVAKAQLTNVTPAKSTNTPLPPLPGAENRPSWQNIYGEYSTCLTIPLIPSSGDPRAPLAAEKVLGFR